MKIAPFNTAQKQASPNFGSASSSATKILKSKIAKNIEFDGLNMPFPILITAMLGGVLLPRLVQAQDKYDRSEILLRDITSEGVIVFGSAALSKAFAKHNEKKSGFALTSKPENFANRTLRQKMYDYFMPTSELSPFNSKQIIARYSELKNTKGGMTGFCDFIDTTGGNLNKLFSFKKETKDILEEICGKETFNKADNKTIIDAIKNAAEKTPEKLDQLYKHFEGKDNDFVKKAKAMNSAFGFFSMVVLVPVILGFGLPAINAKLTKKRYEKDHANTQTAQSQTNSATSKNEKAREVFNKPGFMAVDKNASAQKTKEVFSKIDK